MESKSLMLIVVFLAVFLVIFGISGGFNQLTGKASTNIVDCEDSDGGVDAEVGGDVIGSYDSTKARSDYCVNSSTLGEYYCDVKKSDGKVKEIFCENGCASEGGFGVCKKIGKIETICKEGCAYNDECIPVGTRLEGRYCDWRTALRIQKDGQCDNSYECKSNLCISGNCLTEEAGNNFLKDVETTHWWE